MRLLEFNVQNFQSAAFDMPQLYDIPVQSQNFQKI